MQTFEHIIGIREKVYMENSGTAEKEEKKRLGECYVTRKKTDALNGIFHRLNVFFLVHLLPLYLQPLESLNMNVLDYYRVHFFW